MPAPGCGNGVVDAGEACDDANETRGDGCHACVIEQECIVTHESGRPASFSAARVAPDLTVIVQSPLTLPAGDDDGDPGDYREDAFGRITTCGAEHAYAVLRESDQLAHVSFDDQGNPALQGVIDISNLAAVVCEPGLGVVYAVSSFQGGEVVVRSFVVGADGSLTGADELPVTFFQALNYTLSEARVVTHPLTGSLWLTGYFFDVFTNNDHSATARVESDARGTLTLAEAPTDIGAGVTSWSFRFNTDGRYLAAAGVDGTCTVVWRVGESDTLPTSEDAQWACGYEWESGDVAWYRDSDRFHLVLLEEVLFGGFNASGGLESVRGTLAPTRARFMETAYDGAALITVSAISGRFTPYALGESPEAITAMRRVDVAQRGVRSIAKFPCIP